MRILGTHLFKISKNQLKQFNEKYDSPELFIVINGSMLDSYYAPYRSIQKSIIRQLLEKLELGYDSKALSINMEVRYETEEVSIVWNSWIPKIQVEDKRTKEEMTIRLKGEIADRKMELIYN